MRNPIKESLEYWAQNKPNEPAIIYENDYVLTWKEWNDKADRLADAFERAGLEKKDIVAVRTQNCVEWFVVIRALGKLGCIFLPINWRLTSAEVRHILQDSGAKAIVFDDEDPYPLVSSWEDLPLKIKVGINSKQIDGVTRFEDLILERVVTPRFSSRIKPERLAYSSGTTGLPKGVYKEDPSLLGQRQNTLVEYYKDIEERRNYDSDPNNRSLVTAPLHHGMGSNDAELAFEHGNTVVLTRRFDSEKTLELIQQYKITHWFAVPTMLKRIMNLPQETLNRYDVSSLKQLITGAAPVPSILKEWAISFFGEQCLYEGYGATEVGLVSLLTPEMQSHKLASAGYPYRHVQVQIRDEEGRQVKAGEVGEIWAKTPVTIERYFNQARLGPDTLDAAGYCQTGDMGYLDEDGYLYICDRVKDMIISGGVNIYPAEIETVLIKHPAVVDVAVIGIPDDEFGEQVKAFCELNSKIDVTETELIAFCAGELASYKRPKSIEFVDELPRNTVGKLLKRELRKPYWKEKERNV